MPLLLKTPERHHTVIIQLGLSTGETQKHQVYLFTQIPQFRKSQHQRPARWGGGDPWRHLSPPQQLICRCGKTEDASDSWGKSWRLLEIKTIP